MTKFNLKEHIAKNKATFFGSLTEGQFSWFTQDTDQQIGSEPENTLPFVYMHDNKGNKWLEKDYEGYGVFGGKDYYELLDQMNGGTGDRERGIDLAFDKEAVEAGKVLFPALTVSSTLPSYHSFNEAPKDDPNQSWYTPEEDEENDYDSYFGDMDREEDYDEEELDENMNKDASSVAEKFAQYMSKKEGKKFTVTPGSVDEKSFDLDVDGMEYEGGSYLIKDNGDIVNVAITPNEVYGNVNQLEEGKAAYEYEKGKKAGEAIEKKKMKKSELKAKIKEMVLAEMDGPAVEAEEYDFLKEIEEMLDEADEDTADAEAAADAGAEEVEVTTDTTVSEVDPNVEAVQDALTKAQAAAQQLGDKKLMDQIGNTITFFTRSHVVEKPAGAVTENLNESMFPMLKKILK